MDEEWKGEGRYKPDDGSFWQEATGQTKWVPCDFDDPKGLYFFSYLEFKNEKRILKAIDRLPSNKVKSPKKGS